MAKSKKKTTALKAKETDPVRELSIQRRAEEREVAAGYAGVWWFGCEDLEEIPDWWRPARDQALRDFVKKPGNDILAGAVSSMVKKFKAMNWVLEGPERVVNRYQKMLAEAEFGKGWSFLLSKTTEDYHIVDRGAFWELIGAGKPEGPMSGPVLGVAHLDACNCTLTGDPVYPVLYSNPKDGKPHKLHATRVVHFVDMPSPNESMHDVGFSGVSRVIESSNVLLRLARYKNEKLSDLPQAGLLLLNNVMPTQWEDVKAEFHVERRRKGQEFWMNVMTLIGLDPAQPVTAELLSFAGLPDAFDEASSTEIYVNVLSLAFGVDVREFWPMSAGPLGTAVETQIQHQKAKGKGVGDWISTVEREVNWRVLPPSVTFRFDFEDIEEEGQKAEIDDQKVETIMRMWDPPKEAADGSLLEQGVASRAEIRQMLADNVPGYFAEEFLAVDITEEVERTDTERDKAFRARYGRKVAVDRHGRRRPVRGKPVLSEGGRKAVDAALAMVEANYRRGDISLDDALEFRLGSLLDGRLLDGDG